MTNDEKIVVISGSAAFDVIAFTEDAELDELFESTLKSKEESDARISISVLVNKNVSFGGTALNIAYNMRLLGANPYPISCVGKDFAARGYKEHLDKLGITTKGIEVYFEEDTAEAYIVTGKKGGQMAIFHSGSLSQTCNLEIKKAIKKINASMAIISPNPIDTMTGHAKQFKELTIPYICDPGQMINMIDKDNLLPFVSDSAMLIVNDYEATLVENKLGKKLGDLVELSIITRGENGSTINRGSEKLDIKAIKISELKDPTGAGDAFRGGFLFAVSKMNKNLSDLSLDELKLACQIGAVSGGYAVEQNGTQNHSFKINEFKNRYEENFGKLELDF